MPHRIRTDLMEQIAPLVEEAATVYARGLVPDRWAEPAELERLRAFSSGLDEGQGLLRRHSDEIADDMARDIRVRAFAASSRRFFGGAFVSREFSRPLEVLATSSTAERKAASFAFDGLLKPLTFLTNCKAAARTSSSVTGGSKLNRVLMFLHMDAYLNVYPCKSVESI